MVYLLISIFVLRVLSTKQRGERFGDDPMEGCVPNFVQPSQPYFYDNLFLNYTMTSLPDWSITQMNETLFGSLEMFEKDYPVGFSYKYGEDVFYGASGRAFLYLRVFYYTKDKKYLDLAKGHNDFALSVTPKEYDHERIGFLKGRTGMLVVGMIIYSHLEDTQTVKDYYTELTGFYNQITIDTDFQFDNGLAGMMNAARILKRFENNTILSSFQIPENLVLKAGNLLFERGLQYYNDTTKSLQYGTYPGLGVGGANGGPTTEIMRNGILMKNETIRRYIQQTVDYYLTQQLSDGDMVSDPGYPNRVQWCHGSPGFIGVFLEAYKVFNDEKYLDAARKASKFTQEEGILKKGVLLGHGIAGNIYMIMDLYRFTLDPKVLSHALSMLLSALKTPEATDLTEMISYDCCEGGFWFSSTGGMIVLFSDVLNNLDDLSVLMMPVWGN